MFDFPAGAVPPVEAIGVAIEAFVGPPVAIEIHRGAAIMVRAGRAVTELELNPGIAGRALILLRGTRLTMLDWCVMRALEQLGAATQHRDGWVHGVFRS